MIYYIDFDNTLFDTERFYSDLLNIINKYNINEEDINMYYKNNCLNELFNPIKIINIIIKTNPLKKQIMNEIELFLYDLSKYLYNDTISFLEYLNNNNYQVNLLTYGDFDYQNIKISNSYIKEYFNKIIITSKNKFELDLDYKNSIFIDDDIFQIDGLLKKDAFVKRIRRKGNKHSKYSLNNVSEYENFIEMIDESGKK